MKLKSSIRSKGEGKEMERQREGKRKGEMGSEALSETEKNRNRAPAVIQTWYCQQMRLMPYRTTELPGQATSPASLFDNNPLCTPPLHNIGIIRCPLTKPDSGRGGGGGGCTVAIEFVHREKGKNEKVRFQAYG